MPKREHVQIGRVLRLDHFAALGMLRDLARDRSVLAALRRLWANEVSTTSISFVSDEQVLAQLAHRIASGSLVIARVLSPTPKAPPPGAEASSDGSPVLHRQDSLASMVKDTSKEKEKVNPQMVMDAMVLVKRPYTTPGRRELRLSTDAPFDGTGLFSRTKDAIDFHTAPTGGTKLTFDGNDNKFQGSDLSAGVSLWAEGNKPSGAVGDVALSLVLSGGSKSSGPPATGKMTSVKLTLDVCEPRAPGGNSADPAVLPTAEAVPAAGSTPTDKFYLGRPVPVEAESDPVRPSERAMLIVRKVEPADYAGQLVLAAVDDRITAFEQEKPAPHENPVAMPYRIPKGREVKLFVQGTAPSAGARDTGYQLGIDGVDKDGDRVSITAVYSEVVSDVELSSIPVGSRVPETPPRVSRSRYAPAPLLLGKNNEVALRSYTEVGKAQTWGWTSSSGNITLTGSSGEVVKVKGQSSSSARNDVEIELLVTMDVGKMKKRHTLAVVEVDLEINNKADVAARYVGWAPAPCRIKQISTVAPLEVMLQNAGTKGKVLFFGTGANPVTPGTPTLTVPLPADGSWVSFWMGGEHGHASENNRDAAVQVQAPWSPLLKREFMVRIRKNANTLTPGERDRFLAALGALNSSGQFQLFRDMHTDLATAQAHFDAGFLPWHRAYILDLERELQNIDSSVALPYWRFDQRASTVFTREFMGVSPAAGVVEFNAGHPLEFWTTDGAPGVDRTSGPRSASLRSEAATLLVGPAYATFCPALEDNPHGRAHVRVFDGWLNVIDTAVKDPLFFLLHCNVDRLWAKWQQQGDHFDPGVAGNYDTSSHPVGHNLPDTMWPWNGVTGGTRPPTAPGGPMPGSPCVTAPGAQPTVQSQVDFQGRLDPTARLGFDYDDVPYP